MGHRANFVIVKDNQFDIYYSHWGAITIPKDIFYGPQITINYIQSLKLVDALLDDIWCEGAVLVDMNQKLLLFWGGYDYHYPALRKYFIPLLQINWSGWGIRWADEGNVDIARYLQIDLSLVQTDLDDYHWTSYRGDLEENSSHHSESIITVKYNDKLTHDYGFDNYLTELFSLGSDLITLLQTWEPISLPQEDNVNSGAYINLPEKEIWVWWGRPTDYRVIDKITEYWHGWTVKRHREGLPFQIELSSRDADNIRMKEEKAIQKIINYVSRDSEFDPSKLLQGITTEYLQEGKSNIWVNPDAFRNEKPEIKPEEKQGILQKIIDLLKK
jgi:hypothetical protein